MNTLTKNRILQKGDEYRKNGTWKPVPEADYGLQIMFTKYAEVRRPTETPFVHGGAPAIPISPDNVATAKAAPNVAKAEKEKSPAPTPSGAGETPPVSQLPTPENLRKAGMIPNAESYLPTVVSKKAHKRVPEQSSDNMSPEALRETPDTAKDAPTEVAKSPVSPTPSKLVPATVTVSYPDKPECIWTGRNGTFKSRAIRLENLGDVIRIVPVGKRGTAKNAVIEFPASITKQVITSLESMLTNSI
jgi:hypothetical protein